MSKTEQNIADTSEETPFTGEEFDPETEAVIPPKAKTAKSILAAIAANELPRVKSRSLIGKRFDVLNATASRINDDEVVVFELCLHDTGEIVSTAKSRNAFTENYVEYFECEDAEPIADRTFVEFVGMEKAGNAPVTIRSWQPSAKK